MGAIDLYFDEAAVLPGGPIHIVFGADPVPPDGYVDPDVATVGALSAPVVDHWQDCQARAATVSQTHGSGVRMYQSTAQRFDAAKRVADDIGIATQQGVRCANSAVEVNAQAARIGSCWAEVGNAGQRVGSGWYAVQCMLARASAGWLSGWIAAQRVAARRLAPAESSHRRATSIRAPWASSRRGVKPLRDSWQAARRPLPGRWDLPVIPPPQPGCYTPPHGIVNILFDERAGLSFDILFTCPHGADSGPVVIPILRYYIVINSASLSRVSNGLTLPVSGLSVSIDSDSAHWSWSGSLPLRSLSDLERDTPDEPVELEAIINGQAWRLTLTSVRETERFGGSSLQIGGRGIAAELSDPIYPAVSHNNIAGAAMAQQLAEAALSINGVPLGWSLDWQAPDWLVPAGAWVHNGTPLDAVVRIAAAAGSYVQAAPASRTLRVLPRYPVAPWEWSGATPAVVLPAAAVLERGAEHVDRAGYNVVYVSGQAGGILARVKRGGTAGDRPAQMVVDSLITHADAARGRGLEVLGNTGAQQIVSLETGIMPASGVIHVGTLMDWMRGEASQRGLVRSLAVSATVPTGASKDPVKVRQTVGVEIHG